MGCGASEEGDGCGLGLQWGGCVGAGGEWHLGRAAEDGLARAQRGLAGWTVDRGQSRAHAPDEVQDQALRSCAPRDWRIRHGVD